MYDSSKVDLPKGFSDQESFVKWARETYESDLAADDGNRKAGVEDIEFMGNEQWDEFDEQFRRCAHLPVLTLNQIPAFVQTVIGNHRLNEITVKVTPDTEAQRGPANLRDGIVRSILKNSVAKRALDKAYENEVICGIGNFGVGLDYARDDVFEQDICVFTIPSAFAVVWDKNAVDPTGRDARHVFLAETVTKDEYDSRWPDAKGGDIGGETEEWAKTNGWIDGNDRRILTVWRINEKTKTLILLTDGTVQDVTGKGNVEEMQQAMLQQNQQIQAQLQAAAQQAHATGQMPDPTSLPQPVPTIATRKDGSLITREAPAYMAQRWVISASEILEGPYELPIDRVPIFRCTGWEINIGPRRVRWGLVRLVKDAQRLFNFWRSIVAEQLLYAPKSTVTGPASAFEGRMEDYRNMHLKREPLVYNDEATRPPEFVPPPPPNIALMQQASMALEDMRNILNLHEASLGIQSNEVSAKAIVARQKIGEMGTVIYDDNFAMAVEELGRTVNQLVPVCYDTPRFIKTYGVDDKEALKAINQGTPETDVTAGKYDVTITTGPSSVTKRAEAAEAMLTFVNAAPQVAAVAADLIVEAQDWPNAGAIAERLRNALPPNLVGPDEMTDEQKQAQQQNQMVQQQSMALEFAAKHSEIDKNRAAAMHSMAMASEATARAGHAQAQAAAIPDDAQTRRMKVMSDMVDSERDRQMTNANAQEDRLAELFKNERQGAMQLERDRAVHTKLAQQGE